MSGSPYFCAMKYAVVLGLMIAACSASHSDGPAILATVNGDIITAEEFRLNYEFGHGHLRRGPKPEQDYLRYMVLELVLAQEAERVSLDTLAAIEHAMHTLREELLIEQVFEKHVLSRVQVSDDEIAAAINQDAVKFQFRFLPAQSLAEAERLRQVVEAEGFDAALDVLQSEFDDLGLEPQNLESPAVAAEELEPAILAALQELPLYQVSDPIEYRGLWYLFEVTNIQRQPLSPDDYAARASSFRKVVFNKKAMEAATTFINELMAPLNVTTQRNGFDVLSDALWAWYRHETPARNLLHYIEAQQVDPSIVNPLVAGFEIPLVRFGAEEWTIRDFLEHFTPGRYLLRARERGGFDSRLADVVALVVRDHFLLSMAETEKLYQDTAFERTAQLWKDKWLFQELRKILADSAAVTWPDVAAYYADKNVATGMRLRPWQALDSTDHQRIKQQMLRDRVLSIADSLAQNSDIAINESILDTMTFSQSAVNPQMTVHLLKSNSNKMPFPIADPNWLVPARQ